MNAVFEVIYQLLAFDSSTSREPIGLALAYLILHSLLLILINDKQLRLYIVGFSLFQRIYINLKPTLTWLHFLCSLIVSNFETTDKMTKNLKRRKLRYFQPIKIKIQCKYLGQDICSTILSA